MDIPTFKAVKESGIVYVNDSYFVIIHWAQNRPIPKDNLGMGRCNLFRFYSF